MAAEKERADLSLDSSGAAAITW